MKILIVAATYSEISPLLDKAENVVKQNPYFYSFLINKNNVDVLITGVGIASTAFLMGKILSLSVYDIALNLGIAGSFRKNIEIGAVLNVATDVISELGTEDGAVFLKFNELKLSRSTFDRSVYFVENSSKIRIRIFNELPIVKGITVNTVHGNKKSIEQVLKMFSPDVETMEGAAFLYACQQEKVKCAQVRAISNYVEERNTGKWNTDLAIRNLNEVALKILNSL